MRKYLGSGNDMGRDQKTRERQNRPPRALPDWVRAQVLASIQLEIEFLESDMFHLPLQQVVEYRTQRDESSQ